MLAAHNRKTPLKSQWLNATKIYLSSHFTSDWVTIHHLVPFHLKQAPCKVAMVGGKNGSMQAYYFLIDQKWPKKKKKPKIQILTVHWTDVISCLSTMQDMQCLMSTVSVTTCPSVTKYLPLSHTHTLRPSPISPHTGLPRPFLKEDISRSHSFIHCIYSQVGVSGGVSIKSECVWLLLVQRSSI